MTSLLAILLVMIALLVPGMGVWTAPRLLDWGGEQELLVALQVSWLTCLFVLNVALSWYLKNRLYLAIVVLWFALALWSADDRGLFRAYEIAAQTFLLLLWIEVAWRAWGDLGESDLRKFLRLLWRDLGRFALWKVVTFLTAVVGAGLHGIMFIGFGIPAKIMDPGFSAAVPDVIVRSLGRPAVLAAYILPAVAVVVVSWLIGKYR